MNNNTTKVRIIELAEDTLHPLYHKYAGQQEAQPAFLELDTEEETLTADWYGYSGGCTMRVWDGRDIWFYISPHLTADEINRLMKSIAPDCEAILGEECKETRAELIQALEWKLEKTAIPDSPGGVWDAGDFFEGGGLDDLPKTHDEALEVARMRGVTLKGLECFMEELEERRGLR